MQHIRVDATNANNNTYKINIHNNNNIKIDVSVLHILFHFPRSSEEEMIKEKRFKYL